VASLEQRVGNAAYAPVAGKVVTVTLSPANGAAPEPVGPLTCVTNTAGTCEVTFTSSAPGVVTADASVTVSVAGSPAFGVATSGSGAGSPPVTTTWYGARIEIATTASDVVRHAHTMTATLWKHTGIGPYVRAAGEQMAITLTTIDGAAPNSGDASVRFPDANEREVPPAPPEVAGPRPPVPAFSPPPGPRPRPPRI